MFKLGGSAGEGITSGLKPRQGYVSGERVEEIMNLYGTSPKGYNINDFLIQFGLILLQVHHEVILFQQQLMKPKNLLKPLLKEKQEQLR